MNLDKLWSLVSEQTRAKAAASKDKATVIDVTKAVIYYLYIIASLGLLQSSWQRNSPKDSRYRQSQIVLKDR